MDDPREVEQPDRERKPEQARVACSIASGLMIRLTKAVEDVAGMRQMRQVGPQVFLAGPRLGQDYEVTEVDAEFWAEWLRQNELNPVVTSGLVGPAEDREDR